MVPLYLEERALPLSGVFQSEATEPCCNEGTLGC